jgi:hypothetical protein
VKLEVVHTRWGAEDEVFEGGIHEDVKLTRALAPLVAAAEAAGSVRVLDATAAERKLLAGKVQSQADGEKAFAKAQGDWVEPVVDDTTGTRVIVEPGYYTGPWQHGNLLQALTDREQKLAVDDERRKESLDTAVKRARRGEDDIERLPLLSEDERAAIEAEIAGLRVRLAATEVRVSVVAPTSSPTTPRRSPTSTGRRSAARSTRSGAPTSRSSPRTTRSRSSPRAAGDTTQTVTVEARNADGTVVSQTSR